MTEIDPKIHDKIAALLRKAERTDNEAEAAAFSTKAEELLMKWGVDRAMIELEEGRHEEIVKMRMTFPGTAGRTRRDYIELCYQVILGLGALEGFRTRNLEPENRWKDGVHDLLIMGHKSDVESAIWLASSILLQGQTITTGWWKAQNIPSNMVTAGQRAKLKSSFLMGFGDRVKARLAEIRDRLQEEAVATSSKTAGTDLVFVGRAALVKAAFEEEFPGLRKGRGRQLNGNAYREGADAGNLADLGQARVKNPGRKSLA